MKFNFRRAAFEFVSIVVAVILAMTLTEWRQDYLNRQLSKQSLANIIEEVEQNRAELIEDSVKINRDIQFMTQWISDFDKGKQLDDFSLNFSYSFLSSSALEVAKINNSLTFLPNSVNMQIAEMYATQTFYSENALKLFDTMGKLGTTNDKDKLEQFVNTARELRFQMLLIRNTVKAYLTESAEFLIDQALR